MTRRLRIRSIDVIVFDEDIPLHYYTIDLIHLTREGPHDDCGRSASPGVSFG